MTRPLDCWMETTTYLSDDSIETEDDVLYSRAVRILQYLRDLQNEDIDSEIPAQQNVGSFLRNHLANVEIQTQSSDSERICSKSEIADQILNQALLSAELLKLNIKMYIRIINLLQIQRLKVEVKYLLQNVRCHTTKKPIYVHFVLRRHLFNNNYEEESVKKIYQMPLKGADRRSAIIQLRRKGNFVLQKEKNIIKPIRKPNAEVHIDNVTYSNCPNCCGAVKSTYWWRHRKQCKSNRDNLPRKLSHRSEAQTFLVSTGLIGNVLQKSRPSDVFRILRACSKERPIDLPLWGIVVGQTQETADADCSNFMDALKPEHYNYIVTAVKILAGLDSNTLTFKSPSLALQIGTDLKHLCQVAKK
nr:unnamed protein product [Callosobruchus analis]